jgi:tetratricopeptide (TPR) repeat protein
MGDRFAALEWALRKFDGAGALAACERLRTNGNSGDPRVAAGRVRALWLLRRWDEARAELAELDAGEKSAHLEVARGIVALGQPDHPMFPALDRGAALRDPDRALAAFRSASEFDPANAEALAGQATALRTSGRVDEAIRLLDHADPDLHGQSAVRLELALCLAECGESVPALRLATQALEQDPGDLRAAIVQAELLRIGPARSPAKAALIDDLRRRFPNHAGVLEACGWTLTGYPPFEAANALFRESMATDPSRPGAVLGAVTCLLGQGNPAAAKELSEAALRRDPLSPQLTLCRARVLVAEGAPPPKIIEAYRHVLELDPRMLHASLELARTLLELNRRAEARDVIAVLRTEYPHHPEALEGSDWVDAPWRMPATGIETRIENPWEGGRDHPDHVLDHLIGEVARKWQLTRTAVDRLRDRVELDHDAVLEQAFAYEQDYLAARNRYQVTAKRGRTVDTRQLPGYLLSGLAGAAVAAALPWLLWLIAESTGLPDGWRWVLVIGVPLLLAGLAALDAFLDIYFTVLNWDTLELVVFLFALSVPPAAFWQSIRWYGTGPGIVIGTVSVAVLVAVYWLGERLRGNTSPAEPIVQRAFDRWLEYLYGAGLLPLATEVGGALSSPYGTVLPPSSKIVSEAVVDLDTPATTELRQLLRQRSKGSFALAGPRGAGKSTLLERWCAGQFLRETGAQEARRDLTVRVDAPVGYQSKDFLTHLFSRLSEEVEQYAVDHVEAINARVTRTAAGSARSMLLRLVRRDSRTGPGRRPGHGTLTASELTHLARNERNKLRFLQSRTTEGELSLGAPPMSGATLGFKHKSSVKRDDVPLNHPQLVDRFRAFLGVAAGVARTLNGKVLIGIDELDRISDGDGAQQFLNELKAVFNVPNCYFLVSVSEDALADFELSAMGMRTVFDSAFDTIVRVDYLKFDKAKLLLNRRVVDLPEQFSALAYVLSGGLARELVRLSEAICDHKPSEKLDLATVAARLVRRQLGRTTRAAMDRLSRSPDRRAGATLIPVLDEHPVDELTGELLRTFAAKVAATGTDDESGFVAGIRLDVAVMAEYLAVLLDVFDNRLDEPRVAVGAARGPGGFDALARARRYLGANPHGARELVDAFRKAWDSLAEPDGADQRTRLA